MKKEYCKIQKEEKGFYEKIVNVIIKSRNGDGSIVDIHKDIEIWSPAWKVLLGTEENPHKIVDDIQQHCITNNEIQATVTSSLVCLNLHAVECATGLVGFFSRGEGKAIRIFILAHIGL